MKRICAQAGMLGSAVFFLMAATITQEALPHSDRTITREPVASGKFLRHFVLEQTTTAADIAFLDLVQDAGNELSLRRGLPGLLARAETITDLDPLFGYAYEVAGLLLSDLAKRPLESNEILQKGMSNIPDRWQLPFFAAFNFWYALGDYQSAAPLLLRAAKLPGSPHYLADLSSRLFAESGSLETGLRLIEATLAEDLPEHTRTELERRRRDLLIERALRRVEEAVWEFASQEGRLPHSLDEVFNSPVSSVPSFEIQYDPTTGEVGSPLLPNRIHLFMERGALRPEKVLP